MITKMKDTVTKILHPSTFFSDDEQRQRKESTSTKSKYQKSVIRSEIIDEEEYSHDTAPTTTITYDNRWETKPIHPEKEVIDIPLFEQNETERNFDPTTSPLFATPTKINNNSNGASFLYATSLIMKPSPIKNERSKFLEKNYFSYPYSSHLSYIERLRQRRKKQPETTNDNPILVVTVVEIEKKDSATQCEDNRPIEVVAPPPPPPKVAPLTNVTPFSWPKFARAQQEFATRNPSKCRLNSSSTTSIWKCSVCTKDNPFDVSLCSLCFAPNRKC